ncbi:TauD/TfdA family dioxygenase [Streptomyces sp. NPDC005373]|uniref:TauD/TfdA dioxygenase family protein n=1 Tax=Streptomyces sp. NPDC005373 TaxID=3156879 RepID=UPI0033B33AF0
MMIGTQRQLEPFGVEFTAVHGKDLVDRTVAEQCREALDRSGVVVFPELRIEDDDFVAFTRLLGEPVIARTSEHRLPEIDTITMDPQRVTPEMAAIRKGNFEWHIDGATLAVPQQATLLTAREVDEAGGDTEFANTFLAYEALPTEEKDQFDGLHVVHSFAAAQLRAHPDASPKQRAAWQKVPSRRHPLVWTRSDGRKSLLVGATAGEIVGRPAEEGRAVLDRLTQWATQPRFALRHRWRPGDLVIWDNTGMLHHALPFKATSRRLMHRTTLVGQEAVA